MNWLIAKLLNNSSEIMVMQRVSVNFWKQGTYDKVKTYVTQVLKENPTVPCHGFVAMQVGFPFVVRAAN